MKEEILIRKAKVGDEKGIAEMRRQSFKRKNWIYTGSNDLPNKTKIKKWRNQFSQKNPEFFSFVAIDQRSNKLVGSVYASFRKSGRLRHRIDLGWGVHPDYQGQGIGTALLKKALVYAKRRGFKRAEAEVAIKNKSSIKLSKKLSFKIEGRKKAGLLTDDGKYLDTYIIGRLLR